MLQANQQERPAPADLAVDSGNPRATAELFPDPQIALKSKTAAGPHPAHALMGWKKVVGLLMAIRPKGRLPRRRREIGPMPGRRYWRAGAQRPVGLQQRREQRQRLDLRHILGSSAATQEASGYLQGWIGLRLHVTVP